MTTTESLIERDLIAKLEDLKYTYRPDIRDRASLEKNFREKFQALNHVQLTDAEFQRFLDQIPAGDVYAAARFLRDTNTFMRDHGCPVKAVL
jgi:type I restriction enzyme R subunit